MAPFVECLVVVNRLFAVLGRRNARLDPSRVQRGAEIVTVVAAVTDQNTAGWQLLEQHTSAGMIAHLALGQQQDNGLARGVAYRVELGVQPALGASDATRSPAFFPSPHFSRDVLTHGWDRAHRSGTKTGWLLAQAIIS